MKRAARTAPLNARIRSDEHRRGQVAHADLVGYAFRVADYLRDKLKWEPWTGHGDAEPGQTEVIEAYTLAVRQQLEKQEYEDGRLSAEELVHWRPGQTIQNWIRVEAGHTVGKTKLLSGITNHFFDCFPPAVIYTYANTEEQLKATLWKEIRVDRTGKGLPGRILTLELQLEPNHFAKGIATHNAKGAGTERNQGQHNKFQLFILDEAEGQESWVFESIDSMTSGSVVAIVLMMANPRTRTSEFWRRRRLAKVRSFRMSSVNHPNVQAGREVIPGGVRRDWVEEKLAHLCDVVDVHDHDAFTFELKWDAHLPDPQDPDAPRKFCPAGTIFKPQQEFLWRVLGIAPPSATDNTLVPLGRFEAAVERGKGLRPGPVTAETPEDLNAKIGVDVARFGLDSGTIYILQGLRAWREHIIDGQDTNVYARRIRLAVLALLRSGVKDIEVRIDCGGGYGGGVADKVKVDGELKAALRANRARLQLRQVYFNGVAKDPKKYADKVTEMYAHTGEALRDVALCGPVPERLEADLTARQYDYTTIGAREVKELEPKDRFKTRERHSPDDGDGFALCCAPRFIFLPMATGGSGAHASQTYTTLD